MIDYEIVTLSMPMLYLGTLLGVRIGQYINSFHVIIALMVVLAYVIYASLKKAIKLYKKENLKLKKGNQI